MPSRKEARTKLLARSLRGIEWLLAAELRARAFEVTSVGHRAVDFSVAGEPPRDGQLRLGTADDVFLSIGEVAPIDHRRASLAALTSAAARLPVSDTLSVLQSLRTLPLGRDFTVVASFLGSRNYNRFAIEDAVAEGIASTTGLSYQSSRDGLPGQAILTFRVHLVDERATFSVRVFEEPLHRRAYKLSSRTGTLHPPLAHAMALLAGLTENSKVLDPFCGAGTLLLEARRLEPGASCYGVDVDEGRISAARENADRAGHPLSLAVGDAAELPFASRSFDRVLTNLPWGVAVQPEGRLRAEPARFWRELARVLSPEGRAVILTDPRTPLAAAAPSSQLDLLFRSRVSLFGQHPELWVLGPRGGEAIVASARLGAELSASLPLAEPLPRTFGVEN